MDTTMSGGFRHFGALFLAMIMAAIVVIAFVALYPALNNLAMQDVARREAELDKQVNLALAQAVEVDPAYSHGDTKHPDDAKVVRSCLDNKGAYKTFTIEKHKQYLRVCMIDKFTWGFQVVDIVKDKAGLKAKELTAYIKDTIHSVNDLLDFMTNRGYPAYKGPLP